MVLAAAIASSKWSLARCVLIQADVGLLVLQTNVAEELRRLKPAQSRRLCSYVLPVLFANHQRISLQADFGM